MPWGILMFRRNRDPQEQISRSWISFFKNARGCGHGLLLAPRFALLTGSVELFEGGGL